MRRSYCSVLCLLFAVLACPSIAVAQAARPAASVVSTFKVFVRGTQIGTEQVAVERSSSGIVVSGSSRLAPPTDIVTSRCEVRYDAEWRPIDAATDAIIRGIPVSIRARFADGTATLQIEESGKQSVRKDAMATDAVILLNSFFGFYEALAGRLQTLKPGSQVRAYVVGDGEGVVQVVSESQERFTTPGRTVTVRRLVLAISNPGQAAASAELWADETGRLVRIALPFRALDVVREDVASVASHREPVRRDGDETAQIAANGFTLAATVSKPAGATSKGRTRYPAVVLVSGGGSTDRDEVVSDIPIFAQLAGALADAGFVVVRYDKRAVGLSGGRADNATLDDYADDARAAVMYVRGRKDVDARRVALVGYGDGGWVAMLAAARNTRVAALALLAAPGVSGSDVVLQQQQRVLERMDLSPADRQVRIDLQKKIHKTILSGTGWDDLPAAVRKQADSPWYRGFLAFDPATILPRVPQPVLIVQGEVDREVFAPQADRLADLARRRKGTAGKAVALVRVPQVNHLLATAVTGEPEEYARLTDRTVSREVLAPLTAWMQTTLAPRK